MFFSLSRNCGISIAMLLFFSQSDIASGFTATKTSPFMRFRTPALRYRSNDNNLAVDQTAQQVNGAAGPASTSKLESNPQQSNHESSPPPPPMTQPQAKSRPLPRTGTFRPPSDLSNVKILPPLSFRNTDTTVSFGEKSPTSLSIEEEMKAHMEFPFAAMLSGSAPFIASHVGKVAVFHIPGEILEREDNYFNTLLSDIALTWMMGMKIVLCVSCRHEVFFSNECPVEAHAHECYNTLQILDEKAIKRVEEEAGYVRIEVERKLNKYLRLHGGAASTADAPAPEGNVVGGNFYTAKSFGAVVDRSGEVKDFRHTGYANHVHAHNIHQALSNNDVVMLTTVGMNVNGDVVNVNGNQLAAMVASQLGAYKVLYIANQDSVLCQRNDDDDTVVTPLQEIPLSFAKKLTDYHNVQVHKAGFASFEHARQQLSPRAVEMLLHVGWASWAIENGVQRAHIVNPRDGALLEELFTSKNGENTCLYHDAENNLLEDDDFFGDEDWDAFLSTVNSMNNKPPDMPLPN